ncbi:MAG: NTP transferase domain-containing protein [Polyangiaceae bacterium]|nr:NTP transferase domain-containing protein [Polyangiaceae bacterium]
MGATAVVQARLGSSRLPRKVLAPLAGRPMLDWILERVGAAAGVGAVVVSTSDAPGDDALAEHARALGHVAVRAPVDDIIGRLVAASRAAPSTLVARVWGDCPFVDPRVVDRMLARSAAEGLDFLSNALPGTRTYPGGFDVEIYTSALLERMDAEVTEPFLREFPFDFVRARATELRVGEEQLGRSRASLHFTVDYPEDLAAADALYRALPAGFSLDDVLAACDADPRLAGAFSHQARNADYAAKASARRP